jgi:predicted amidohydrolase
MSAIKQLVSVCFVTLFCAVSAGYAESQTFKVAAVQAVSKFADPNGNCEHLARLVRQAAQKGAKVVVLPETAVTGYMSDDLVTTWQLPDWPITDGLKGIGPKEYADTVPGKATRFFAKISNELNIYLTVPVLEVDRKTNKYYNTVVLIDPNGSLILHYRKINPWPFAERSWATKGDRGLQIVDTLYGRMGLLICYDINFEPPHLKELGVDHLLYSIAWVDKKDSDWFTNRLPAIAKENNLNIIGANWTVSSQTKPTWYGYGHSLIIDSNGMIATVVSSDTEEQIIYADISIPAAKAKAKSDLSASEPIAK